MELIVLLLFFSFTFLCFLLYMRNEKTRDRYESKGIPFLGNGAIRMLRNMINGTSIIDDTKNLYKFNQSRGSKLCGNTDFGIPTLVIQDPELIKSVLVKDFDHFADRRQFDVSKQDVLFRKMLVSQRGPEWRSLRSKLSPTFTTGKIKRLFPLFEESGNKLMKYFKEQAESSPDHDVELGEGYSKFAMDIIASAACGMNSQAFDQKEPSLFEQMGQKMQLQFGGFQMLKFLILFTSKRLGDLLGLSFFSKEVQDFFSVAIKASIKQRTEKKEKRNDFIQLMLEAREGSLKTEDSELDNFEKDAQLKDTGKVDVGELLDDDAIVANAVLFILAGFDTTQSLLLFIPYVLALNPEVQDKLRAEIDAIMEDGDGKLSYEAVGKLTYLDMVINETLRMYPPAVATDRGCVIDYKVPGTDYTMKKGEGIFIPILGLHYDPKYYPEPEKFDPERFSPENKANINPYTFLPFGQGPRNCIGMRFALTETKVAIANLVHNFRIEPSKKTPIPMKFSNTSSLKPAEKMHLALHTIQH